MYAELHCISNFSFLRGASYPQELVLQARELGYTALAITDECSLAGVVKAHVAAKECGLPLIIGAEFQLKEGIKVVALATDRTAYSELSALITFARRRAPKGEYELHLADLEHNLKTNLLIWKVQHDCAGNDYYADILQRGFSDRLWLGFSNLLLGDESERYHAVYQLALRWQIPMVACGDAAMHHPARKMLLDTVVAIQHVTPIEQLGFRRAGNGERYLRSIETLQSLYPQAMLQESTHIARRCRFSLDELKYEYPPEVIPPGYGAPEYLAFQVNLGAKKRWPQGVPLDIQQRIGVELALIHRLEYEYYFLTVFDIVNVARDRGILCQGRGSAANSVVCYCLGITEVSPDNAQLLFERFISEERKEPPDIDVDFEHERREEIIQYIYKKYTRERAALAATVICYRSRSAIRDVGKALGFDAPYVDHLSKSLAWWDSPNDLQERFRELGFSGEAHMVQLFFTLVHQLRGFPRHLSQHVGGFVITKSILSELVPVENASMKDRTVIQWDKEDLEAVGLMKIDVLALGMLTAIRKCLALISPPEKMLTMADIPQGDEATYAMLQRADSVGVFQVESRAQMSMLPRLKPKEYYDLVVQVAIVRPGPIQGNMVHPYLRRRQGLEPMPDIHPVIWPIVKRTYGVPIFQEQVIKLAMDAAGFSGGDADRLRRAMATWGKNGNLMTFRQKLIDGMLLRGHALEFAESLFEQMKGFGAYGFPESHAASFALLVYISAYLKNYYPAEFCCALMNSQPMGFYSPSQLIQDARRHSVVVHPVAINSSAFDHVIEKDACGVSAIRLGFRIVKGLGDTAAQLIVAERMKKPFADMGDLQKRTGLNAAQLAGLIAGDALRALSGHRHQAHWQARAIKAGAPLLTHENNYDDQVQLNAPSEIQDIVADYNSLRLSLKRHPMAWLRERHELFRQCRRYAELGEMPNRFVRVAGLVTGRQRPGTESNLIFITLEDETGNTNVIVREPIQQRYREALLKARVMMVKGVVESSQGVVHVTAGELIDCSRYLTDMELASRDFH
ncbi:MAG: polymerase subunit alpha [Verrucomicrobiaceae bacterium]|nr:polymerase subunit alpha [Verrucomicrobiaceae bacterium]